MKHYPLYPMLRFWWDRNDQLLRVERMGGWWSRACLTEGEVFPWVELAGPCDLLRLAPARRELQAGETGRLF